MLAAAALACAAATAAGTATAAAAPLPGPGDAPAAGPDVAGLVDTFLGTQPGAADQGTGGGAGNDFPGADVPFGMVQWSPDTVALQQGGYFYQDNRIRGFSLTHLSGAGCDTYEDIPFMPVLGAVTDSPATNPAKYTATFSHAHESASPGRYGVTFDNGVTTELTTTQRTGSGRFTFPAGQAGTLLVNTSGSISGTADSQVTIGRNTISGYAVSGNFCGAGDTYKVFFYAQFDQNFQSVGTWHNGAVTPGKAAEAGGSPARAPVIEANKKPVGTTGMVTPRSASVPPKDVTVSGPGSGGFVSFDAAAAKPVNVRIGLSFVSADGARGNLAAENNGTRTFDQVAAAARATWNSRLGEIAVTGGTDEQQRTFYSNLYHSLLQPNVFSDANGQYQGFDGRTHTAARGHAVYTNFSGWDIYRSESQLLALLAPAETADIVTSMIDFAQQGGSWDRWTVANGYTGVMNGDPYHIIVANAYAFGATGFDAPTALSLMVKGATQPTTPATGYVERPGLADYLKLGYVPGAAADTLEYTSADFAIAQLAQRLGDSATVDQFMPRAQNWQHLFNPATGYLEPRAADGSLPGTFSPGSSTGYVEGNGAQYSWMVPYNEGSLIAALGGNDAANTRLDTFFGELNAGTSRPFAFLSNEPSSETPWLYDYTGKPSRTQAIVRRVQNELFNSSPSGLQGNDDLGQLGSWYVWSALGLFPEIPGRAELLVGSPMFTSIKITTPAGHHFSITAPAASPTTQYVTGLTVDGRPSTRPWLPEDFARNGGTLDFALSSAPDPTWGSAAADAPPSFQQGQQAAFTFTDPARLVIPQDASDTGTVGTQDLTGKDSTVTWTAQAPAGLTVTPASGSIALPAGGKAGAPVTVTVAGDAAGGTYRIPITFSGPTGQLPGATLTVLVAKPGSIQAAVNNVGVSPDSDTSVADYDGDGFSYSADALAAAGVTRGAALTMDGLTMTWPSGATGDPDNVTAAGQTINLPDAVAGASTLELLGSSTNGDTSGTLTITYADGSTQTATIGFSDWTLGGGSMSPSFGNKIAVSTPYRNMVSGGNQRITTDLFATAPITLAAGKTVASITLPDSTTGSGALHVFSVATGTPAA